MRGRNIDYNRIRRRTAKVVVPIVIALGACAPALEEPAAPPPAVKQQEASKPKPEPKPEVKKEEPVIPADDPMALEGDRMITIAADMAAKKTPRDKINVLFDALHAGAENGVKVMEMEGKKPRTPVQALEEGGDCTELSLLAASLMHAAEVPGGIKVVHFTDSPPHLVHVIPYAVIDHKKVIIDLQADKLDRTKDGKYDTIIDDVPLEAAAWMYYRELGTWYFEQGRPRDAVIAYEKSVSLLPDKDGHVYHELGMAYAAVGNVPKAAENLEKAEQINSSYRRDSKIAAYKLYFSRGEKAHEEKRFMDCAADFRAAQQLLPKLGAEAEEKKVVEDNINTCQAEAFNSAIGEAVAAYEKKEWRTCRVEFQKAVASGEDIPHAKMTIIERNTAICRRWEYNTALQQGAEAYKHGKWEECSYHFQVALDSGEEIPAETRTALEKNRDKCENKKE